MMSTETTKIFLVLAFEMCLASLVISVGYLISAYCCKNRFVNTKRMWLILVSVLTLLATLLVGAGDIDSGFFSRAVLPPNEGQK